jgi:hypothetical protein
VYDTEVKGFGAMLFANSQEPETDRKAHMASNSGAVTLGDVAGKLPMLDVACSKCDRRGRLSIAELIAERGADMRLPDLREILAGDCPRVRAASVVDRCGARYPQLVDSLHF